MDIPNFKGILQKLTVVRNYSGYMLPVVLVVAGLILFIPSKLMSNKLKAEIEKQSVGKGKRIRALSSEAVPRNQWKVEQEYQQAYEQDANQIALLARQSSQRELLSYRIFPEPKDTSILVFGEFGDKFRAGVDGMISDLNARECPTDAELEKSLQTTGSRRPSGRSRRSSRASGEVQEMIEDELCRAVAASASFYASLFDVAGYEFWGKEQDQTAQSTIYKYESIKQSVMECWYWQLGYWIVEDVFKTIGSLNSASENVLTAPVKRLIFVGFTSDYEKSRRGGGSRNLSSQPDYVASFDEGALVESLTRRQSNDDIDVVHFKVVVLVDSDSVLPFMKELCSAREHEFRGFFGEAEVKKYRHNQITVLESDIQPIVRDDKEHELYRYGDDAVMQVDLMCEYIFNKVGYDEIKPESIKKLGSEDDS